MKGSLPALLLTGLLLLVCGLAGFSAFKAGSDLTVPAPVALVDEEDSFISRLCIGMVRDADFVDELISIEKCDRARAMQGLESGDFAAAIILPEDYTSGIMAGRECNGTIVLAERAAYMSALVSRVAELGERLLAAGQYGVFAGEELIVSGGLPDGDYSTFLALSNTRLIDTVLDLENEAFETVILPYSGFGTGITSHFVLCWTCLAVSVCGMFFTALYNADRGEALRDRLKSCGVGNASFMFGKILWPFAFRLVLTAGLLAVIKRFAAVDTGPLPVFYAVLALFLCSCFTGGLALSFPKGAPWIVLLLSLGGLFFCGGLLPLQYIPDYFFSIGKLLPSGAIAGMLAPVFGGNFSISAFVTTLFWAVIGIGGAFIALSRRSGKEDAE